VTVRARRLRGVLVAAAAGIAMILVAPAPAFAHNYLVDSSPEEGATLTDLPAEFSVTTNEPLLDVSGEAAGFALEVRDADGGYYGDGCLAVEGSTLATPAALGDGGEYTVGWQVVSADGHTVDGEFAFTWDPPAGFTPASAADAPPNCGAADAAGGAASPSDAAEAPSQAVSSSDLLWVLGTVVVVGVVLFGTMLLLTRRRTTAKR
jgi:methionine-rich copper-binding protein CopC